MAVSFRYKAPEAPKPLESSGSKDFDADRGYLSSKEELQKDIKLSMSIDPDENSDPFTKPKDEAAPAATSELVQAAEAESAPIPKGLARLIGFIKAGLKSMDDVAIDPAELKRRKALASYQAGDRVEQLLQQKGLQLDKAA